MLQHYLIKQNIENILIRENNLFPIFIKDVHVGIDPTSAGKCPHTCQIHVHDSGIKARLPIVRYLKSI